MEEFGQVKLPPPWQAFTISHPEPQSSNMHLVQKVFEGAFEVSVVCFIPDIVLISRSSMFFSHHLLLPIPSLVSPNHCCGGYELTECQQRTSLGRLKLPLKASRSATSKYSKLPPHLISRSTTCSQSLYFPIWLGALVISTEISLLTGRTRPSTTKRMRASGKRPLKLEVAINKHWKDLQSSLRQYRQDHSSQEAFCGMKDFTYFLSLIGTFL